MIVIPDENASYGSPDDNVRYDFHIGRPIDVPAEALSHFFALGIDFHTPDGPYVPPEEGTSDITWTPAEADAWEGISMMAFGMGEVTTLTIARERMLTLIVGESPQLETISLPNMNAIDGVEGGLGVMECPSILAVDAPKLETVNGIEITSNALLPLVAFPELNSITGVGINISSNDALTSISFPKLTSTGELNINRNPMLQTMEFPELDEISSGGIQIIDEGGAPA